MVLWYKHTIGMYRWILPTHVSITIISARLLPLVSAGMRRQDSERRQVAALVPPTVAALVSLVRRGQHPTSDER